MVVPLPFTLEKLPPSDVNVAALFENVSAEISGMRARRGRRPLVPNGSVLVGQEQLAQNYDTPGIVIVPRSIRFEPGQTRFGDFSRTFLQTQWLQCEAHLWGEDDPDAQDILYSFGSCIELLRELTVALVDALGNQTNLKMDGAHWDQRTDVNRRGRVLVLDFALRYFILTDPPASAPLGAPPTGVQVTITPEIVHPDQSVEAAETFTVPP